MCTDHDKLVPAVVGPQQGGAHATRRPASFKSAESHSDDIESHEMSYIGSGAGEIDLNFYRLVNEVWHFCSVDWGSRCKILECLLETSLALTNARSLRWVQFSL